MGNHASSKVENDFEGLGQSQLQGQTVIRADGSLCVQVTNPSIFLTSFWDGSSLFLS